MNFNELGLIEPIVRAVTAEGYSTPSPIQEQAIPDAIEGRDVLGCAQTGTGKTCAFALPILQRLAGPPAPPGERPRVWPRGRAPRALVLAPTRELATQIYESFCIYGKHLPLRHTPVFGGVNQFRQVKALRNGIDVLVATPGRLLDLINQGYIDLSEIEVLVLDEADRMLDMGFINDIRKVVDMLPEQRQTLFFSATVSSEIRKLAASLLDNPVRIETAPEATTVDAIAQRVYHVERMNKSVLLERVLRRDEVGRTLVFTRTKHGADKLTKVLLRNGINADAIHGNKSQNARNRAMQGFKTGQTKVLVATDVASRGIDVDNITHVVNYDMPVDPETYVHRIGRTARAGASGIALSFCDRDEMGILRAIERRSNIKIEVGQDFPELAFEAHAVTRPHRPGGGYGGKPSYKKNGFRSGGKNNGGGGNRGGGGGGGTRSRRDRPSDERFSEGGSTARPRKAKPGSRNRKPGGAGGYAGNPNAPARSKKNGTGGRNRKSNAGRTR